MRSQSQGSGQRNVQQLEYVGKNNNSCGRFFLGVKILYMDKDLYTRLLFFEVNGNNIAPCIFQSHLHKCKFIAGNMVNLTEQNWFKGKILLTNRMMSIAFLIWAQQVYTWSSYSKRKNCNLIMFTQGDTKIHDMITKVMKIIAILTHGWSIK